VRLRGRQGGAFARQRPHDGCLTGAGRPVQQDAPVGEAGCVCV
jgi:hypothetical protein